MNTSTEGVTLMAAFISGIIETLKHLGEDTTELEKMVTNINLENPFDFVPIEHYNKVCNWVENHLGKEKTIEAGFFVGKTAFDSLVENGVIEESSSPFEILRGIDVAAGSMVDDPEGRGIEIIEEGENHAIMRRTQTFNGTLQIGVLQGILSKSILKNVTVGYLEEVAKGAEFDIYKVEWN